MSIKEFFKNLKLNKKRPVIFFDLFDTLVKVDRGILESYFDNEIDRLGDLGKLKTAEETISLLLEKNPTMEKELNMTSKQLEIYYEKAMKKSLMNPSKQVLEMLQSLKEKGYDLCVISDASFVDIIKWYDSPLAKYFDKTIFSCEVGFIKPDLRLYNYAKNMMRNPNVSIFVGDGGHNELMGAHQSGMITIKAEWIKNYTEDEIYKYANYNIQEATNIIKLVEEIENKKRN